MLKNPAANAGDMGVTPDLGRSHMLQNPRDTVTKSMHTPVHAPQQEKPLQ